MVRRLRKKASIHKEKKEKSNKKSVLTVMDGENAKKPYEFTQTFNRSLLERIKKKEKRAKVIKEVMNQIIIVIILVLLLYLVRM